MNCFWEFYKKPSQGEIYNTGGGRFSNCSILEAISIVEDLSNIQIKRHIFNKNRVGIIFGIYQV